MLFSTILKILNSINDNCESQCIQNLAASGYYNEITAVLFINTKDGALCSFNPQYLFVNNLLLDQSGECRKWVQNSH